MKAIYVRVSTEDQAKNGYSIQDQIRECRLKAGTNEIIEYVDEGISGEILDRPQLSQLRKDVKAGLVDEVICLDPDRLSRKLGNQIIIADEIEKRAKLIFVNGEYAKTPEGILFFQMRGAISEFEKAKITERMSRGRREKARQGKVIRDYQIYGYKYNSENNSFILDEFESNVVKLIFQLFTDKDKKVQGINGIAKYLTEQGIPTKRSAKVWHRQVVRQILMNRAYIGEFYQNRWNAEGMLVNKYKDKSERIPVRERPKNEWILVSCPVIIEQTQFIYTQKLLEESRRRWAGTSRNGYLLSGLVRCGNCGNTMPGRRAKNWGKYVYEYYDLKNTAGAKNKGCGKKIKVNELDETVWKTVLGWLDQPEAINQEDDKDEVDDVLSFELSEIERVEKMLIEKKEGKKRLLSIIVNGKAEGIYDDEITDVLNETNEQIAKLAKQLNELKEQIEKQEDDSVRINILQQAVEHYLKLNPEQIFFEDKQELIRFVVREVRVYNDMVQIFCF